MLQEFIKVWFGRVSIASPLMHLCICVLFDGFCASTVEECIDLSERVIWQAMLLDFPVHKNDTEAGVWAVVDLERFN